MKLRDHKVTVNLICTICLPCFADLIFFLLNRYPNKHIKSTDITLAIVPNSIATFLLLLVPAFIEALMKTKFPFSINRKVTIHEKKKS